MQKCYNFIGGDDLIGRMFVYEEEMKKHDLSSEAIRDFARAIKKGDLDSLIAEFKELNEVQKKGLLNLYIDYNDLWGNFLNLQAPMGFPYNLAKQFGHEHIVNFIEEEHDKLTVNNISSLKK